MHLVRPAARKACKACPCMRAGQNTWPGANLVTQDTGAKFVLKYQDRTRWVEKLKVRIVQFPVQ